MNEFGIKSPTHNLASIHAAVSKLCREVEVIQVRSSTIQVNKVGRNVMLEVRPGVIAAPGGKVTQYLVKKVREDFLECVTVEIGETGELTEGTATVQVAKPHDLRCSTWNGKTIGNFSFATVNSTEDTSETVDGLQRWERQLRSVQSTDGSLDDHAVTEYVIPKYVPDKTIILAATVDGTITVLDGEDTTTPDPDGIDEVLSQKLSLTLCDVNDDGRRWDMKYRDIDICVSGLRKRVRLRVSAAFDPPANITVP